MELMNIKELRELLKIIKEINELTGKNEEYKCISKITIEELFGLKKKVV